MNPRGNSKQILPGQSFSNYRDARRTNRTRTAKKVTLHFHVPATGRPTGHSKLHLCVDDFALRPAAKFKSCRTILSDVSATKMMSWKLIQRLWGNPLLAGDREGAAFPPTRVKRDLRRHDDPFRAISMVVGASTISQLNNGTSRLARQLTPPGDLRINSTHVFSNPHSPTNLTPQRKPELPMGAVLISRIGGGITLVLVQHHGAWQFAPHAVFASSRRPTSGKISFYWVRPTFQNLTEKPGIHGPFCHEKLDCHHCDQLGKTDFWRSCDLLSCSVMDGSVRRWRNGLLEPVGAGFFSAWDSEKWSHADVFNKFSKNIS